MANKKKKEEKLTIQEVLERFEELDRMPHREASSDLWAYFKSLIDEGFSRREALKLTEIYSNYIYDLIMSQLHHRDEI